MPRRESWAEKAARLAGAQREALRRSAPKVQLARLDDAPPKGDAWLHEIKWDGYRIVTTVVDGKASLWSRNGITWTAKLPKIAGAIEHLGLTSAVLDGELIAGGGSQADFGLLQRALSGEPHALTLVLFDLLHVDGVSIAQSPLIERKGLLEGITSRAPDTIAYSSHSIGQGDAAFAFAESRRFEGIISKRVDRPYVPGRGDDWRKVKLRDSDEFAVVGFTPPKGARTGFGSLLLATPDPAGVGWIYAGRVGSGFSADQIRRLAPVLQGGSESPSVSLANAGADRPSLRGATWFPPRFVAEVNIRGRTTAGLLRQPSLKAIRPDKDVADLLDSDRGVKRRRRSPSGP